MGTTLFLLIYVTIFLPVIVVFSYVLIKALQAPTVKPGRIKLSPKEREELFNMAFRLPWSITPFPQQIRIMNKKLHNNQRKWIQIGRLENEMKHLKARYKRFKEYSHAMPVEDIKISLKEVSKELKKYKYTRKKLIRQALMSPGE